MRIRLLSVLAMLAGTISAQTVDTIPFRAILSPANETPPITGYNASGAGTVLLHVVRDSSGKVVSATTDFLADYKFPGSVTITGMHIHKGDAGVAGPVTINSGLSGTNSVAVPDNGTGTLNLQGFTASTDVNGLDTVNGMLANPSGFYLNIHTTDYPGGVIRGQLQRADMTVVMAVMKPDNEVPPITDLPNAQAVASVLVLATRDSSGNLTSARVTFDANYSGFPATSFTGFHIHNGPAGVNAGVVINTGVAGGANAVAADPAGGNLHYNVEVPLTTAAAIDTVNGLFTHPQDYYINLHTVEHPGGAIRSQLRKTDKMVFPITLSTANEIPAVTTVDGSAPSVLTIYTIRDATGNVIAGTAIFDVNYRFAGPQTFTGLHIHNGDAKTNGPVTINTGLSGTNSVVTTTGSGNVYRVVTVSTVPGLATLNSLVMNPENHYVNIHTTDFGGGLARSQVAAATTALPTVSAVLSAISDSTRLTVANGGLATILGSNFMKVPDDITSSSDPATLPTAFNGTQVTIGGKNAALLASGNGYMVVQVPNDVPAGSQPVVVKNSNGASDAFNATVAPVAPAIFFNGDGGIFQKNSDFSLVTSSNPAKAGDVVLIYSTGLGITTPALQNGQVTPGPGANSQFYNTKPVTVTVGGQNAQVIYSLASPGYAGLYQTAIVIPSGAGTGKVPVILKSGDPASNTVTIQLQ